MKNTGTENRLGSPFLEDTMQNLLGLETMEAAELEQTLGMISTLALVEMVLQCDSAAVLIPILIAMGAVS